MTELTIGIDISKDHLDAHRSPGDERRRFDNTAAGHGALIRWIGAIPARIVYEPTGPYHRKLEVQLAAAQMPIVKVNPRQAKRFAEATGQLAKTDRLDAAMLARMGALLSLEPRPVRDAVLNDLKDLHLAREALVKDRTAAKNRAKAISLALLRRHNTDRLKQIEQQLAAVDAAIAALIEGDPVLAERFAILVSIPGVAAVTAAMLVTEMPELGRLDPKQAAALAGLAPIARQSGQWKGKSFVHGGRKTGPPGSLHAGPRRHALQPGPESQIRPPRRSRKSTEASHHRRHAKARRPRQRPPQGAPNGDPKNRLIITDTPAPAMGAVRASR